MLTHPVLRASPDRSARPTDANDFSCSVVWIINESVNNCHLLVKTDFRPDNSHDADGLVDRFVQCKDQVSEYVDMASVP